MSILRAAFVLVLLAAAGWCQTPAPEPQVPFEQFAEAFRKAHAIDVSDATGFDAQSVLARDWLCDSIGALDVLYPRKGLEEKARLEELRDLTRCIVDLQALWLEWFGQGPAAEAARADLALLGKWLKNARPQMLKLSEPKLGVLGLFGAGERELSAAARATAAFTDGTALGYKPRTEVRWQVLFAPTRREFLELVAFFGWADPDRRDSFWDDSAARWSECYWNSLQVLSLEDPPQKPKPDAPWDGVTMNLKAPTGAVEHVATRSAHTLCTTYFGFTLDAAFESGLCMNTAIALYSRNNSRSGGSGRGNTVDGWSMFVPGGNKNGGPLPGLSAESSWRSTAGSDWFVKPLRDSQRVASKDSSRGVDKVSTFEVTANDGVQKLFIRAPFFGTPATVKELPAREFLPDYAEFFRAYKSCFVHWLAVDGADKPGKASQAKLAEFLRSVAAAPEGTTFEELIQASYGAPWSAADPKPESLEWSFLAWLSRQK